MGMPLNVSKDLALDLGQIVGQCVAILGIRGSGKSNTAGVLFEELLKHHYPLSIVNIDGEYFGLKEKYEILVVGSGEGVEIEVDVGCAAEIARVSMEKNVPVVLDLSDFLAAERTAFLMEYLSALWDLAGKLRRPYIIGIEEAHEFIPQGVRTELKELVARIALRGRKRGLGAIIISQRSAKVEKDVLSQAGILFLHRVVHEANMRVYSELLPWRKIQVKEMIGALETGDCMYINGETILPIYVRERETFHAGFTPSLEVVVTPQLQEVSQSILEAIERTKDNSPTGSNVAGFEEQLERAEALLAEKENRIRELEEEVAEALEAVSVAASIPSSAPDAQAVVRPALPSTEPSAGRAPTPREVVEGGASAPALPEAVRRHIDRLVARVASKGLVDRRILAFLVGHGPRAYSVGQIAAWTDCARGVIEEDPPRDLLDMGLIVRERRSGGVHYRSNLKAFVVREFEIYRPDLSPQELRLVAESLRTRLATLVN